MSDIQALLGNMIDFLSKENPVCEPNPLPQSVEERLTCWRGLINQRPARPVSDEYLAWEDAFLAAYHSLRGVVEMTDCQTTATPKILTYHGDITQLAVDAIVNAANSKMLGCLLPNHLCVDNAIHTFAGFRLRLKCHELMRAQGHKEPVGQAKITEAYNLPSRYVIHTVGPIVAAGEKVSPIRADLLRQSYRSCLKLAQDNQIQSLAFCSISTGEFGFPKKEAAAIAVDTVKTWLNQNQDAPVVIFNTFGEADRQYYHALLQKEDGGE